MGVPRDHQGPRHPDLLNPLFELYRSYAPADDIKKEWFSGAIDQILAAKGSPIRTVTVQEYSGAEDGHDDGLFVTRPL